MTTPTIRLINRVEVLLNKMRLHASLTSFAALALLAQGLSIQGAANSVSQVFLGGEKCLIETGLGKTRWINEDEKWQLRSQNINFMDITHTQDLGLLQRLNALQAVTSKSKVTYPSKTHHNKTVQAMIPSLNSANMRAHLETFTSFHTRYYKSEYGAQSSAWLLQQVNDTLAASGVYKHNKDASVKAFAHPWGQASIIATLPGQTNKTVVIGAHQDSINLFLPSFLAAPGADDDGSGTVTILEALRVLLKDDDVKAGKQENTIEFHWYSAEEGGLLGSQAIFSAYELQSRDVVAMLQQDMTGYIKKTLEAGEPESVGVITDFVDPELTDFIKKVVETVSDSFSLCLGELQEVANIQKYCTIPYTLTKCGYACSDHASASKAGYPSAFVIESDFKYSDKKIHTTEDKIEYLSFSHMLQHARLTLGLVYELGFAKF